MYVLVFSSVFYDFYALFVPNHPHRRLVQAPAGDFGQEVRGTGVELAPPWAPVLWTSGVCGVVHVLLWVLVNLRRIN